MRDAVAAAARLLAASARGVTRIGASLAILSPSASVGRRSFTIFVRRDASLILPLTRRLVGGHIIARSRAYISLVGSGVTFTSSLVPTSGR